ncbi:MAG TPA: hypothetical protein VM844_01405 [Miltoncostaeaceae bacterium]|jgi:hypothetical protein|nr:hypothetical protein [Miltoncostaeaceae bacterium]
MRDHREHDVRTGLADPPIDEWERQGALRELTRLARDLQHEDADAVVGRLGRLTGSQRAAVAAAMERILELGDQ